MPKEEVKRQHCIPPLNVKKDGPLKVMNVDKREKIARRKTPMEPWRRELVWDLVAVFKPVKSRFTTVILPDFGAGEITTFSERGKNLYFLSSRCPGNLTP